MMETTGPALPRAHHCHNFTTQSSIPFSTLDVNRITQYVDNVATSPSPKLAEILRFVIYIYLLQITLVFTF